MKFGIFFTLILFSFHLNANIVGNDTQNFNPITSGLNYVTVQSSDILEVGFINSGFFVNQAANVLPEATDAQGRKINSTNQLSFADLSLGYGIGYKMDFGLNLSYLLNFQSSEPMPGSQFSRTGLNELRTNIKYQFQKMNPWGFAFAHTMNINQVEDNPFTGKNNGPTQNLEFIIEHKWGDSLVAFNFGRRWRSNGKPIDDAIYRPLPDQYIASAAISRYMTSLDSKFIFEWFTELNEFQKLRDRSSEGLLGIKYDANETTSIHFGYGQRISIGMFAPDWRFYAGLNWSFNTEKKEQQASAHVPVQPILNSVNISIYKGFQPQDIEKLKDVPFDVLSRNYEFTLSRSIPSAEPSSPKPPFEIVRLDGFDFDFGSSVIKPEHFLMLNKLAEYIKSKPSIIKLRIEGHTDSLGSEERNRSRSQSRADVIKDYLLKQNVNPEQPMVAVGYGSSRPIADNSNTQGRTANRRVEIRILRRIPEITPQ